MMNDENYIPPKIWTWKPGNGGRFASINRPIAGATHDKTLPVGAHLFQLYSLATPNVILFRISFDPDYHCKFPQTERTVR